MTIEGWRALLDRVTAVAGVRGALLVSIDDGLVVAEAAMESIETADVAALAASLVTRAMQMSQAAAHAPPRAVRLSGEHGTLMAFAADEPLWLVAVADPSAELGRLRLLLGDLAATIA